MASYEKELKRSKDGSIIRYVGYNLQGVPEKFRLGYDMNAAKSREAMIRAMWDEIEGRPRGSERASWDVAGLKAAKEISKGKTPIFPKRDYEDVASYAQRLQAITIKTGTAFEPIDPIRVDLGLENLRSDLAQVRMQLSTASNVTKPTGVTLGNALDAYDIVLRRENTEPTGALRPWGKTQVDQLKSVKTYLGDVRFGGVDFTKLDLTEITYNRGDDIYSVFRKRPLTLRSKLTKRMTPSSAKNLIKALGNFFDWLDGEESLEWMFPRRFHSIVKTPDTITSCCPIGRALANSTSNPRPGSDLTKVFFVEFQSQWPGAWSTLKSRFVRCGFRQRFPMIRDLWRDPLPMNKELTKHQARTNSLARTIHENHHPSCPLALPQSQRSSRDDQPVLQS